MLRFGKMSAFALIGALGAVANIAIVWLLSHAGVHDLAAMIIAAETTIIANFLLQERFVFQDMREQASGIGSRFAKSFSFNNIELLIRIPITTLMISSWHISVVIATAVTLVAAFVVRFLFHSLVVYAPRRASSPRPAPSRARYFVEEIDRQAISPGEI
jgi:dolichol-phosphate mannosyltransferase